MTHSVTVGVHHVGPAVPDLEAAERFFVDALGWTVVGGVVAYPAVFVSDGTIMVTLWRVADPSTAVPFDRRTNVGLHHLALKVIDDAALAAVHERIRTYPGVTVEFDPEPMWAGSPPGISSARCRAAYVLNLRRHRPNRTKIPSKTGFQPPNSGNLMLGTRYERPRWVVCGPS